MKQNPKYIKSIPLALIMLCSIANLSEVHAQDADNDGVMLAEDLDNDNDGILDSNECNTPTAARFSFDDSLSSTSALVYTAVINGVTESITITASTNPTHHIGPDGVTVEPSGVVLTPGLDPNIYTEDYEDVSESAITFTSTIAIQQLTFPTLNDIDRTDGSAVFPTDALCFDKPGTWQIISGDLAAYDVNTGALTVNNPAGNAEANISVGGSSTTEFAVRGAVSDVLTRGSADQNETNGGHAIFMADNRFTEVSMMYEDLAVGGTRDHIKNRIRATFFDVFVVTCPDTDDDGLTDNLDTDSDNDGCPDAVEAGHLDVNDDGEVDGTGYDATNGQVTGAVTAYTGTNATVLTAIQIAIGTPLNVQTTVASGNNVTLTVSASALRASGYTSGVPDYTVDVTAGLNFQWFVDTGSGAVAITGETATSLILSGVSAADNGNVYSVQVSHNNIVCYELSQTTLEVLVTTIDITDTSEPGDTLDITLTDSVSNTDDTVVETVVVVVINDVTGEEETITLTETGPDTGVFVGTVGTIYGATSGTDNDGVFNTSGGNTITVTFDNGVSPSPVSDTNTVSNADTDGDGDPDNTDPEPLNPCVFTPGSVPDATNTIWQNADCDGDGVINTDDLDDDNDGVLDSNECGTLTNIRFNFDDSLSSTSALVYTALINGVTETITVTPSTNPTHHIGPDGVTIEPNGVVLTPGLDPNIYSEDYENVSESAVTFSVTIPIQGISFPSLNDVDRTDGSAVFPTDALAFDKLGTWEIVSGDLAAYDINTGALTVNNPAGNAEANISVGGSSLDEFAVRGGISDALTRGLADQNETNNGHAIFMADNWFTQASLLYEDLAVGGTRDHIKNRIRATFFDVRAVICPDTDGDGLTDNLDTDSDNDGCPDAVEAGHLDVNGDGEVDGTGYDANGQVTGADTAYSGTVASILTATQITIDTPLDAQTTLPLGDDITLTVSASALEASGYTSGVPDYTVDVTAGLNFQWFVDTGSGAVAIAGETTMSLMLSGVSAADNGNVYSVQVSHNDKVCYELSQTILEVLADATIDITDTSESGDTLDITLTDPISNTDDTVVETVVVVVINDVTGEEETIILTETGPDTGVFVGTVDTTYGENPGTDNDGVFNTSDGNTITVTFDNGTSSVSDTGIVSNPGLDSDTDTVPDDEDLDNDNDGILDSEECVSSLVRFSYNQPLSSSAALVYTALIDGVVESITITASTNPMHHIGPNSTIEPNGVVLTAGLDPNIYAEDYEHVSESAITFTSTIEIQELTFPKLLDFDRTDGSAYYPTDALAFDKLGTWEIVSGDLAAYDVSTGALTVNNPAGNAANSITVGGSSTLEFAARGGISDALTRGSADQDETNDGHAIFKADNKFTQISMLYEDLAIDGSRDHIKNRIRATFFDVSIVTCPDTDGDGLTDNLDTDSDNDGCPDAIEAGHLDEDGDGELDGVGYDSNGMVIGASTGYTGTNDAVTIAVEITIDTPLPVISTASTGGTAILTVAVSALEAAAYNAGIPLYTVNADAGLLFQWYVDTGSGFVMMPGETNSTLEIQGVSANDEGNIYMVQVSHEHKVCYEMTQTTLEVVIGNTATIDITDTSQSGDTLDITLTDSVSNTDNTVVETVTVVVINDVTGEEEIITLTETGPNTGVFVGTVDTTFGTTAGTDNDGVFNTTTGDTITVTYDDALGANETDPDPISDTDIVTNFDADGDGDPDSMDPDPLDPCVFTDGSIPDITNPTWQNADCDGDGVVNIDEYTDGTDHMDSCDFDADHISVAQSQEWVDGDCDNDNISNGDELSYGDTDGDGLPNYNDPDDDDDGVDTINEDYGDTDISDGDVDDMGDDDPTNDDTDGDGIPDYLDTDDDNDGILTIDENPDPNDDGEGFGDDAFDSDGDGLPDYLEYNNSDLSNDDDDLEIFNAVTPNGDGSNDVFTISNIESYPDNELHIYNRWGVEVYNAKGYGQNGEYFSGESGGRATVEQGDLLPVGTYFYILRYRNNQGDDKKRAGYLYIQR